MKKIFLLTILLISASYYCRAQNLYHRGFIVTLKNDTVRGWVKEESKYVNAQQVTFRRTESADAPPEVFNPSDLLAYCDSLNHYRPMEVHVEQKQKKAVFLRIIIEGQLSLYRLDYRVLEEQALTYTTYDDDFYYLQLKNKPLVELQRIGFLQQSLNALGDCPAVQDRIRQTLYRYEEKSLAQMTLDYNACFPQIPMKDYRYKAARTKLTLIFGVTAGVSRNLISKDGMANRLKKSDFRPGVGITAGIFVEVVMNKRLRTRTWLGFVGRQAKSEDTWVISEAYKNSGEKFTLRSDIKMSFLTLQQHVVYNLTRGKIQPYASCGFGVGLGLLSSYSTQVESYTINADKSLSALPRTEYTYGKDNLITLEGTFSPGVGTRFNLTSRNAFLIEARYELTIHTSKKDVPTFNARAFVLSGGIIF